MSEKMIELYKQLETNEKRNELSSLIQKLDQIITQLTVKKGISSDIKNSKNYDSINQTNLNEYDMLLFFYEDIWNIKNKVLSILVENSGGE